MARTADWYRQARRRSLLHFVAIRQSHHCPTQSHLFPSPLRRIAQGHTAFALLSNLRDSLLPNVASSVALEPAVPHHVPVRPPIVAGGHRHHQPPKAYRSLYRHGCLCMLTASRQNVVTNHASRLGHLPDMSGRRVQGRAALLPVQV